MSNPSAPIHESNSRLRASWSTARRAARATAFWSAVTLPFLYLPLFVIGPQGTMEWLVFGTLLAVHVVSLFAGHTHNTSHR